MFFGRLHPAMRAEVMHFLMDARKHDTSGELPDGQACTDVTTLKPLWRERSELFARNLAEKLLIYATGRRPTITARLTVREIANSRAASEWGFRSLIHAVVQSDSFRFN